MIKKQIKDLSELEKKLLLSYTLGNGSPTLGRAISAYIQKFPDIHPVDLRNTLLSLVAHGYLKTIDSHGNDSFFFTEDGFFEANKHFKKEVSRKTTATHSMPAKNWYEKPFGITLLAVISGLIVVYLAYYFGWNGPKENKQRTQEKKQSAMPASNIPKKIPKKLP
jgi:hypothetical protein